MENRPPVVSVLPAVLDCPNRGTLGLLSAGLLPKRLDALPLKLPKVSLGVPLVAWAEPPKRLAVVDAGLGASDRLKKEAPSEGGCAGGCSVCGGLANTPKPPVDPKSKGLPSFDCLAVESDCGNKENVFAAGVVVAVAAVVVVAEPNEKLDAFAVAVGRDG